MSKSKSEILAERIVDSILGNLVESDFVTNAGMSAYNELRQYRADMILDAAYQIEQWEKRNA